MTRPHDRPAGESPVARDHHVEVLCDETYALRRVTYEHRRPDGSWRSVRRETYDVGNSAAALLVDETRDTVLLVRQYRLPAHLNGHPDGLLLEAPAGKIDDGETPDEAMRRELVEELGHRVDALELRGALYPSPGALTERIWLYVGRYGDDTRVGVGGGRPDEDESIEVVELPLAAARHLVDDGRIVDMKTVLLLRGLES
jgi:nudix-type nucleoside diphosphatase (YffH/AdpP family)